MRLRHVLTIHTQSKKHQNLSVSVSTSKIMNDEKHRAENETRTRDPNLGKVVLYQLSYFRIIVLQCEEEETRTPTG